MPQFQPIEKTNLQRAVNTDKDIIKVGDLYYMCFQGVWFMGTEPDRAVGSRPVRFRARSTRSPRARRRTTSPTSTVSRNDERRAASSVVAAAAYTGMMIAWGCAVWGIRLATTRRTTAGTEAIPPTTRTTEPMGMVPLQPPGRRVGGPPAVASTGPYGSAGWARSYNPTTGTYARGVSASRRKRLVRYMPGGRTTRAPALPEPRAAARTCTGAGIRAAVRRGVDSWARGRALHQLPDRARPRASPGAAAETSPRRAAMLWCNVYRRSGGSRQKARQRRLEQRPAAEPGTDLTRRRRGRRVGRSKHLRRAATAMRPPASSGNQRTRDLQSTTSAAAEAPRGAIAEEAVLRRRARGRRARRRRSPAIATSSLRPGIRVP